MKTVVQSFVLPGGSVELLKQQGGFYEVVARQQGRPTRVAGIYEHLMDALNRYHTCVDSLKIVLAA